MLRLFYEQYPALSGLAVGLALVFRPPPVWRSEEKERQRRLAELRGGAEEAYLEERRSLESYGPDSAGPFRLMGALLAILGVALFLF